MYSRPLIPRLGYDYIFPDPHYAMKEGLLAYGGDLNPDRILMAYRQGIFPWYNENDPILWWSPDPRLLLYPHQFKLKKSLRKRLRKNIFTIQLDRCFVDVMRQCATIPRPGQAGSWILPEVIESYDLLYQRGFAHSIEIMMEGELVGGLYGISIGGAFFGESMFAKLPDASKAALAYLVELAKLWGMDYIDCQIPTPHLMTMGAQKVSRDDFLRQLKRSNQQSTKLGQWHEYEKQLKDIVW